MAIKKFNSVDGFSVSGSQVTVIDSVANVAANSLSVSANANITGNITATGNVQGQYFIGDGSKLTGIAPTVQVYETANIASGINGYYTNQWLGDYTQGTLGNVTATVSTTATFIAGFITELGYPNITVLPIGTILVNVDTQKGGGGRAYSVYAEIYARTTGGTETLLTTTDTSSAFTVNTIIQQSVFAYILSPVTLASTDRIVVKIYGQVNTGTADISVRFDGGTESALQLPALPASISNFVPYTGATANLNLGSNSLETTGNITGAYILGNGSQLTSLTGGFVTGEVAFAATANTVAGANVSDQVANALVSGTVYTNAQPNITSVGTLTSLGVTGDVTSNYIIANGSSLSSITGANVTGEVAFAVAANSVAGANVSGEVAFAAAANSVAGANVSGTVSSATSATTAASANAVAGANVSGTVANATFSTSANLSAYANIVTDAAQPNITSLGTLTSLTTNGLVIEGELTANANAQFNGDVFFTGNVTLPGTINQISGNSGQFFGNASTGFGALYAGLSSGYTLLAQEVMQYATSFDGYTQVSLRNINSGSQATGDFVVTADNGNDETNFIDLGIAGSGYDGAIAGANNALGTSLFPGDGYVYSQGNTSANTGGNLVLGSNQPNKVVKIIAGGSNTADVSLVIASANTATTTTTTGTLTVAGGIGLTGNLAANSIIGTRVVPRATSIASSVTPTPNADTTDQYEVTALASAATFGAPTGTPTAGQKLTIRIKDNGTSQTLAWNAIYRAIGLILPSATVANKLIYVGCIYNTTDTKWDVVAVSEES
jgi:hypothetical protein